MPGSYAEQVRSAAVDGTLLYGPYKEFDAGKYIVVWRAASLEGSKGKSVGYGLLNIAQSKGGKLKSINGGPIGAMDFDAKTFSSPGWRYVPLPFAPSFGLAMPDGIAS